MCHIEPKAFTHHRDYFKVQTPDLITAWLPPLSKVFLGLVFLSLDCMALEGMGQIFLTS